MLASFIIVSSVLSVVSVILCEFPYDVSNVHLSASNLLPSCLSANGGSVCPQNYVVSAFQCVYLSIHVGPYV